MRKLFEVLQDTFVLGDCLSYTMIGVLDRLLKAINNDSVTCIKCHYGRAFRNDAVRSYSRGPFGLPFGYQVTHFLQACLRFPSLYESTVSMHGRRSEIKLTSGGLDRWEERANDLSGDKDFLLSARLLLEFVRSSSTSSLIRLSARCEPSTYKMVMS